MAYLVVHKFRFADIITGRVATAQPSKCASNTRKSKLDRHLLLASEFDSLLAPHALCGSDSLLLWLRSVHLFQLGLRVA
jgi:hypothetical protein